MSKYKIRNCIRKQKKIRFKCQKRKSIFDECKKIEGENRHTPPIGS